MFYNDFIKSIIKVSVFNQEFINDEKNIDEKTLLLFNEYSKSLALNIFINDYCLDV